MGFKNLEESRETLLKQVKQYQFEIYDELKQQSALVLDLMKENLELRKQLKK